MFHPPYYQRLKRTFPQPQEPESPTLSEKLAQWEETEVDVVVDDPGATEPGNAPPPDTNEDADGALPDAEGEPVSGTSQMDGDPVSDSTEGLAGGEDVTESADVGTTDSAADTTDADTASALVEFSVSMKKSELFDLARSLGVKVSRSDSKDELVSALRTSGLATEVAGVESEEI